MLNYVKDMFRVYEDKPKFMFAFHGELSHDYANKIAVAEHDLIEWLEWFQQSGYLNNTVMVFMSDHGQRYIFMSIIYKILHVILVKIGLNLYLYLTIKYYFILFIYVSLSHQYIKLSNYLN